MTQPTWIQRNPRRPQDRKMLPQHRIYRSHQVYGYSQQNLCYIETGRSYITIGERQSTSATRIQSRHPMSTSRQVNATSPKVIQAANSTGTSSRTIPTSLPRATLSRQPTSTPREKQMTAEQKPSQRRQLTATAPAATTAETARADREGEHLQGHVPTTSSTSTSVG